MIKLAWRTPEETVECNYSWNRNNIFRETQCNPINRQWCIAVNARLASKRFDGDVRLNAKVKNARICFFLSLSRPRIMCCLQSTAVTTGPWLFVIKKKKTLVVFTTILSHSYTRRGRHRVVN